MERFCFYFIFVLFLVFFGGGTAGVGEDMEGLGGEWNSSA